MESPLFSGFTETGAKTVLVTGEVIQLEDGAALFEEGDAPDSVFFLMEGDVEAYVVRDGVEMMVVGTLPAGALIGELAVLCEAPRAASVRVVGHATLLKWDAGSFRRLLLRYPNMSKAVFREAMKVVLENQQALIEKLARQGAS
jgi:CRP-like cAMP-binding protein